MLVLTCKEKNSANEITQMGPLTLIYFYFILFWWTSIYILHANEMHLLLHVKRHVVGEPFKTCVLTLHVWVVVFSFGGIFNKPYGSFCCFTLALIFSANSQPTKTWIKRHPFCINNMWRLLWYHVWVWVTLANMKGVHDIICQALRTMWPLRFSNVNFT
jgi:hypothetical protein